MVKNFPWDIHSSISISIAMEHIGETYEIASAAVAMRGYS